MATVMALPLGGESGLQTQTKHQRSGHDSVRIRLCLSSPTLPHTDKKAKKQPKLLSSALKICLDPVCVSSHLPVVGIFFFPFWVGGSG